MKLILATVSNSDVAVVMNHITENGFFVTRISTKGQFLSDGHSTLLIGSQDEDVETIKQIIKDNVTKRYVESEGVKSTLDGSLLKAPVTVEKGGAVVFVVDVEDFEKI